MAQLFNGPRAKAGHRAWQNETGSTTWYYAGGITQCVGSGGTWFASYSTPEELNESMIKIDPDVLNSIPPNIIDPAKEPQLPETKTFRDELALSMPDKFISEFIGDILKTIPENQSKGSIEDFLGSVAKLRYMYADAMLKARKG